MRGGLKALAVVVVVYLVILALAWLFQRGLIYHPDVARPDGTPSGAAEIELTTADGLRLGAWLIPANASADRNAVVLVANGNAGNRVNRVPLADALTGAGFTVLLFDYRGYGGNPGSPTEEGLYEDARAAHAYLTEGAGYRPEDILYFGESLGCGVVSKLATEHPPAGMLLRSPFVDLPAAGRNAFPFLPVRLLLTDRFPVAENVAEAKTPLTVVYGTADSTIPSDQSRDVAERAADSDAALVAIDGANHNDAALSHGPAVVDAMTALADRVGLSS